MHRQNESRIRSIIKSILWRVVATINSFIVSWCIFKTIETAFTAALLMNITGFVIYYLYERTWNKIRWGKIIVTQEELN